MNIDRHNYEEYFLLYVDNELSSEERRLVEEFAQRHPDLREELDLLLQFRAEPDAGIAFPEKTALYKTTGAQLVNDANYAEWLLLYTDNELNAGEKAAVEQYVAGNPAAAAELGLLLQTRPEPETIPFPDKSVLYRKEEKVRYFPFRYWRAAAAVLLLGIGLATAWQLSSGHTTATGEMAGNGQPARKDTGNTTVKQELAANPSRNGAVKDEAARTITPAETTAGTNTVKKERDQKKLTLPVSNDKDKESGMAAVKKPSNNLPSPDQNPYANDAAYNSQPLASAKGQPLEKTTNLNPLTNPAVTIQAAQPSPIIQASYNTSNDEDGFAGNDGKKNKLRGLFRKVTRNFEKRTDIDPTDDNRLLVAGLSIRLK